MSSEKKNSKRNQKVKIKLSIDAKATGTWSNRNIWLVRLSIMLFAVVLYANTLTHDYVQDDAIVIYDNMFVTQGFAGITGLLQYDTFYGFFKEEGKANLVSGGRYRPLTPVMFAVGWQIFGHNPLLGHLWNMLLYGLIGILIYEIISRFQRSTVDMRLIGWLAALFFIAHPVHTEVVANIKGRDEIMALLGSLLCLYAVMRSMRSSNIIWLCTAALSLFLASASKENAVTFVAVIPLTVWYFGDSTTRLKSSLTAAIAPLLGVIAFIIIRSSVLGLEFGAAPSELMNNPFIKLVNGQYVPFDIEEKLATIIFTLGKYIQLLFFPHPLTHDYYPRHIEIMSFGDTTVWLSIIMYAVLAYFALRGLRDRSILSYCIIFFILTISIVSNIIFPIGTNMSERFLFMPSVGFAFLSAYVLAKIKNRQALFFSLAGLVLLLFSIKTISRNQAWSSDYNLFQTDKHTSKNSAKLNNAVAGALSTAAFNEPDELTKTLMLQEAVARAQKAIEIHPYYKNAYLLKANSHHYLKEYEKAATAYEQALRIDPGYDEAIKNAAINDRELGRYYGQVENNLSKSIDYLKRSLQVMPDDYEANRLIGTAYGFSGEVTQSIKYFSKAVNLKPKVAGAYVNLGKAYMNDGRSEEAQIQFSKAKEIDPNVRIE